MTILATIESEVSQIEALAARWEAAVERILAAKAKLPTDADDAAPAPAPQPVDPASVPPVAPQPGA